MWDETSESTDWLGTVVRHPTTFSAMSSNRFLSVVHVHIFFEN